MISSVAHGVKNPLGVLLMGTEYLEKKAPRGDPAAARVAEDMRNAITRADAIVRALLHLSSAESLDRENEDFIAVIEASLTELEAARQSKRVVVARQISPGLPRIPIDRKQCQQAITHLLANAITASPMHGTITIQLFSTDDGSPGGSLLNLVIKDEGCSLQPGALQRAFEPFFTTNQGGTNAGLGLTVARGIVLAHGGSVTLANRESRGAQVAVTLPLADPGAESGHSSTQPSLTIVEESDGRSLNARGARQN